MNKKQLPSKIAKVPGLPFLRPKPNIPSATASIIHATLSPTATPTQYDPQDDSPMSSIPLITQDINNLTYDNPNSPSYEKPYLFTPVTSPKAASDSLPELIDRIDGVSTSSNMKRGLIRSLSGSSGRSKDDPIGIGFPMSRPNRDEPIVSRFNREDPFAEPLTMSRIRTSDSEGVNSEPISRIDPHPEPLTFSRIRPSDAVDEQPPNTFTYKVPHSPGGSSITRFSYKLHGSPSGSTNGSEASSITKTFNITLKDNPRSRPDQKPHGLPLPNCLKPRNVSPSSSLSSSPERAFRIKSPCPRRKSDIDDTPHHYQHNLSSSHPLSAPPIPPSSLRDRDLFRDNYKHPRSISENGDSWKSMSLPRSYNRKALHSDPSYDSPKLTRDLQLPLPRSRNSSRDSRNSGQELENIRSRNSSGQSGRRGSREEPVGASRHASEESQGSSRDESKRVIRSRPGSHEYVRRLSYEDTIGENVEHQVIRPRRGSDPYSNDLSINEVSRFNERFSETGTSSEGSDDAFRARAMSDLSGEGREGFRARTLSDLSDERRRRAVSDVGAMSDIVPTSTDFTRRRCFSSGIDTRSETGAMRPHFNTPPSTSTMRKAMNSTDNMLMQEHRKEINRLKLHVSQLEADRGDGGMDLAKFEQEVTRLNEERDKAVDEKNAISRRFARLQEYLSTLPTIQEYHTLKDQIKTLTDELEKASQDQKIKNKEPSQDSKQKDADIKKYQKKVTESKDKILKLEKENSILKSQSVNQNKQDLQKLEQEKRKMDKTVETLKKEIAVLSEQKDSAKNLSGGYYEKYNNEREKNKIISSSLDKCTLELKELESTVDEKEGVCQDMSQEVARLSEEVAVLSEELHEAEQKHSLPSSEAVSARQLLHGCQGAITDLSGVVQVCLTRSRGGEPNMQQLLGLNSSFSAPNPDDPSTFEDKFVELQQIQSEIEYLRTTVADMYAEEVGNNCGTQ